jgi:hypothetical protein
MIGGAARAYWEGNADAYTFMRPLSPEWIAGVPRRAAAYPA